MGSRYTDLDGVGDGAGWAHCHIRLLNVGKVLYFTAHGAPCLIGSGLIVPSLHDSRSSRSRFIGSAKPVGMSGVGLSGFGQINADETVLAVDVLDSQADALGDELPISSAGYGMQPMRRFGVFALRTPKSYKFFRNANRRSCPPVIHRLCVTRFVPCD